MISVQSFTFNEFQENTYVLYDETNECVIIDPGCYSPREEQELTAFISQNKLKPVKLLNTHCHIDHVLGNTFVAETYQIPLYLHEEELFTYNDTLRWTAMFGIPPLVVPSNKVFITPHKDVITFGNSTLQIAFTPGHSKASVVFYNKEELLAIAGDVLFRESIGRTDLAGGNYETLIQSIQTQLMIWPDEMKIYSGHGPSTTIGYERKFNPFLNV
jgi:glyoxylase-like metal-dependent hydrolase (beta-lactamase superfamily II)